MPTSTSPVPAMIHELKGSFRISTPIAIVDSGPIMPVCAVSVAPMRSMAIITMMTGATVHTVAFSSDSHSTSGATTAAASGRRMRNCAMHSTAATLDASPVSRHRR